MFCYTDVFITLRSIVYRQFRIKPHSQLWLFNPTVIVGKFNYTCNITSFKTSLSEMITVASKFGIAGYSKCTSFLTASLVLLRQNKLTV